MRTTPAARPSPRRWLAAALAGWLALACGTTPAPTPAPSDGSAVAPDLAPLALDGRIDDASLAHDSRDDLYRVPFGAVPAGTAVTLRLRAAAGDLSEATVRVWDQLQEVQALIPMTVAATDRTAGEHGYDYWEATLRTPATPSIYWYRFIVRDGPTTRYVEDDPADDGGAVAENADGGSGRVYAESVDASWQITAYDPEFTTPEWARGAVVYQIFPDRFFDADDANDPSPDAEPGSGADAYRYGDVYGNDVLRKAWDDRPEGFCRAYQAGDCDEQPLGRDFFGGDLAGVTAKLDDLAALGVGVVYLNPIFAAPSNHRYDTSDYRVIDPDLGTEEDFATLVREAEARGIRVVLDGVFNHVSSDSPWFDRQRRFADVGACESGDSPYRGWFTFRPPEPNEPSPCEASAAGDDTYYVGWFGFDTIPEVVEQASTNALYLADDGVARRWLEAGAAGWRLDVMDNLSHGFLRQLRDAVKAQDPDALILGEQWLDTSAWLLGDQADTTMNYRFRRAVIGLLNGDTADLDGAITGLTPSAFRGRLEAIREDYPGPAFETLLNLVDSHDTTRILWTLTPGADDPAVKESPDGLATGKAKLRLVAALQLTWPGMPSIYYGTEAGLTGHDDPDDRRPYPWDAIDEELRGWYRDLGQLRREHDALSGGDVRWVLADDETGLLGYVRRAAGEAALVVVNTSDAERATTIDVAGHLPEGASLTDGLSGATATVAEGGVSLTVPPQGVAILLTAADTDLEAPAAVGGDVSVTAAAGSVDLAWSAAEGAARYAVQRSLVSGGGYVEVGEVTGTTFTDTSVRNGTRYHYVVVALDEVGNAAPRSAEAVALPVLTLGDARLAGPAEVSQPLSAVDAGTPIAALVRVDGVTDAAGPSVGIRAQLGVGPARDLTGDPATSYAWSDMTFDGDAEGADRLVGAVRPEEAGTWNVLLRVSTDGGASWVYADRGGLLAEPVGYRPDQAVTLAAVPAADTDAPPQPAAPRVATVGDASITLAWDAVDAGDLFRYEILRGPEGGELERIGASLEPTFTDDTIAEGTTYAYAIRAVDTSFNRSEPSASVTTAAETRPVDLVVTVALPAGTPATDTIYIAGDFQGWDPQGTPMTKVDDATWTITLPFVEGDAPQYKFTRGSWEAVEKDAQCGEIPNRTVAVTFGDAGTMQVADTVELWRDLGGCP